MAGWRFDGYLELDPRDDYAVDAHVEARTDAADTLAGAADAFDIDPLLDGEPMAGDPAWRDQW